MVALKYWFPAIEFCVLASRRKDESWAPMWVMLLYERLQRSGELLQAIVDAAGLVVATSVAVVVVEGKTFPPCGVE
jgi:hypothetical protein